MFKTTTMKNFDLRKVMSLILGLAAGVSLMYYITSIEAYQHFAHFATTGSKQTNSGWILLIAASLGWFCYVTPRIILKLGHFLTFAMFGIIATTWAELVYGEGSQVTTVFMIVVTIVAFFLTMLFEKHVKEQGS